MFRLTREVRFAINDSPTRVAGTNGYGGVPALLGLGHWFAMRVTMVGSLDPDTCYLTNIKKIDAAVRDRAVPTVDAFVHGDGRRRPDELVATLHERLAGGWGDMLKLEAVELSLSPLLCYSAHTSELPMVRLSQKFEFSATHRLHNPILSDEDNRRTYGKCNNPHGHGHNYEVQVTLRGTPGRTGLLVDVPAFERIVATAVIDRFDHKNLNVEVPEFREVIPSVENIAMTIYRLLKPRFAEANAQLASVTVWETPKTWCEYAE
jgi:6-pyruvoyltetrahydropterin/6-carboxytetrahydropterin synthase